MKYNKRRLGAVLLALLIVIGGAAAYTTIFTAGSGTTYETDSGLIVSTNVDHGLSDQNPFTNSDTVYVDGVSFSATGPANVTVIQFRGTWTNTTAIDVSSNDITINPDDKSDVDVSGGITELAFTETSLDGSAQLQYSASSSGWINVTGLPGSTDYAAVTTTGTILTTGTTSAGGDASISADAATDSTITLLEPEAPIIDDSSVDPADGTQLQTRETEFSIDITDADFAKDSGDTVTAELFVDGSNVGSDTLTTNGTASVTHTLSEGGDHSYHWEATDNYDLTDTSSTFTVTVPKTLTLRQETDPSTLVNNATANITAYYGDDVQRRTTSNGELNLTGFPIDKPIVVRVNASGYYTRTAVIESVYEQSNMYLLNESQAAYRIRFALEDATGEFPFDDSVLFVERDIELNGSMEWRIIAGDNFGIQGVPVDLAQEERYRLRVRNLEDGATATLGKYTAIQSETVTLSPGSATVDISGSDKRYGFNVTQGDSSFIVQYKDLVNQTESITINVHERYNDSNVLSANTTFTNTNELVYEEPMTANESNTTWVAELYIDRGDGPMHFKSSGTGRIEDIIPANLDPTWRNSIGVFVMFVVAMAVTRINVGVGAITTSLVGAFLWWVGLLSMVATGPVVVLSILVSVVYNYKGGGI